MYENVEYRMGIDGQPAYIHAVINGVNTFVPMDPDNADYQQIMRMVDAGELTINTAEVSDQ